MWSSAGGVIGASWRDRRGVRRDDRGDEARPRRSLERAPPRRHLVEQRAEREDVGPRVGLAALRAARAPCTGTSRGSSLPAVSGCRLRRHLGHAALERRAQRRPTCARPKSSSFAPVFVSITLPGLRSRWTIPCLCARVERVGDLRCRSEHLVERQRPLLQAGRRATRPRSAPSRGSRVPSSCPTSKSVQMFGWLSDEIVFASRSKRARNCAFCAKPAGRILIATSRSSRVSLRAADLAHAAGADRRDDLVRAEPGTG